MDSSRNADRILKLRSIARLLDESIPLPGGFRIGLDPILGLVPGLGDVVSAIFSFAIVIQALGLRAPLSVFIRMIGNVLVDTAVGSIPIAGDLFDAAYKSNTRNLDLLARYHTDPVATHRSSRLLVVIVAIFLLLILATIIALPIFIVIAVTKLF